MHHRKNIGAFLVKLATYWFSLRSFESDRFYEKLGIKFFKKYLPTTGDLVHKHLWKRFGASDNVKPNDLTSLKDYVKSTIACEIAHIIGFILYLPFMFHPHGLLVALAIIANILVNIYPIMLQRYNRGRLLRTIPRLEKHLSKS